jgi:hypothetical protein
MLMTEADREDSNRVLSLKEQGKSFVRGQERDSETKIYTLVISSLV